MFKSRKHGVFAVNSEVAVVSSKVCDRRRDCLKLEVALDTVFQQMNVSGNRQRTIESYKYIFEQFISVNQLQYVEDITIDSIYHYLDSLDVKQTTKLIRLKSLKAVLSKFFNNGWIKQKFWNSIQLKIDKEVKKGANESDIDKLLELIDQTSFGC